MVYNEATINKEENEMNNEIMTAEIVENPEPEWSLMMFWEDITDLIQKIFALIKSLF